MSEIHLTGHLVCATASEAEVVRAHLPAHIALTRGESGCLSFEVVPTSDPLVWSVEERFEDQGSFLRHQRRVAASDWGRATAGIERRYAVRAVPR